MVDVFSGDNVGEGEQGYTFHVDLCFSTLYHSVGKYFLPEDLYHEKRFHSFVSQL